MKKKLFTLLLAIVMLLSFGCTAAPTFAPAATDAPATADAPAAADAPTTADAPAQAEATPVKACLISEVGAGVPFVDLVYSGLTAAADELGVEVKLVEATEVAEHEEQVRSICELGYTDVFTMWDAISEIALRVAPEYPNVNFYFVDSYLENDQPNTCNLVVDVWEGSFIAGWLATKTTQTNKIGWIGHIELPTVVRFRDAYIAGAAYGNPDVEVVTAFTGDAVDAVKGKETAVTMVKNSNVDVIFQTANLAGYGVIEGCSESGIKCIGVDEWQGAVDPCVFWSELKPIDQFILGLIKARVNGEAFKPGNQEFTMALGNVPYDSRDYDALPETTRTELDTLVKGMVDGSIDVYAGFDEYRPAK